MTRDILVVTRDRKSFQRINKTFAPIRRNTHSFVFARNIQTATGLLRDRNVAIVLLESLPREESTFSFLSYIWKFFPDIPVLNRAGLRESLESMLIEDKGVTVQSVKMLPPKKWPEAINNTLRLEKTGGSLTISEVSVFAQMIEQEQRTCTLRIYDEVNDRNGILFFQAGKLINARIKTVQGNPAACKMLVWEKTRIDIQDSCDGVQSLINSDLQAILIESTLQYDAMDEDDTNSQWTDAVKIEEESYQEFLAQIRNNPIPGKNKKNTAFDKATKTPYLKTFRRFIPMTMVIVSVLMAAMAYMTNKYRNESFSGKVQIPEKKATSLLIHPVINSKPKIPNTGQGVKNQELSNQASGPSKETDLIIKKKPADTASRIMLLPPIAKFKTKQVPAPLSPIVFIHYTYSKNRVHADQLANYLANRGFVVKSVEQAAFHRNDIRYFQAADREKARTLRNQIAQFFVDLDEFKTIPQLNLKNMTETYSHTSPGQLEVWLRLPST